MVDSRLRRVFDDLPFELNEAHKNGKRDSLGRPGNKKYLRLDFGLDAPICVVYDDKVGDQTQGDNL